jgi:hypothetical protein
LFVPRRIFFLLSPPRFAVFLLDLLSQDISIKLSHDFGFDQACDEIFSCVPQFQMEKPLGDHPPNQ